jgi:hypothetical protein
LTELLKDERYMNINPEYQREVVWSEQRMTHLVNSLFNNYYVPPLIFKVITGVKEGTRERRKWRTCIDGKQRLTTIRRFFDGEIPFIDKRGHRWYYTTPPNKSQKVKIISEEDREFINNVNIVNIEYEQLNDEQEEDMFQRVQLGVPLAVAEKLSALTGIIPSFINDIRKTYVHIPPHIGTKRSNDFKLIAALVCMIHSSDGDDVKLKIAQGVIHSFLQDPNPTKILTPQFRAQIRRVFSTFNELLQSNPTVFTHSWGHTKATMRRFSPVEFLGVGVMLDRYPDRPMHVLAEDVRVFREYLRKHRHDLRSNSATWANVMEYVVGLEDIRGYFAEEDRHPNKRPRIANGVSSTLQKPSPFNPPAPDKQIRSQNTTVYNQRQQQIMQARLALQEQEQREAFMRVPPVSPTTANGGRAPDYAGGVQERSVNGTKKRTANGTPVKRE